MFWLKNKTVLITGGTGSFGKQCVDFLLRQTQVKKVIVFSRDEQKHVAMRRELFPTNKFPRLCYLVGDVRDPQRLQRALRGVDIVIHAAAMKHVDMAEDNPQECVHTNVGGAENVINAAIDCGVEKVMALSTDKAASPVSLYGATKLCSDKLFVAANALAGEDGTRFAIVRYGNVWGSSGSVVPFFQKQAACGSLLITDPAMTRFHISMPQGVAFVIQSLKRMVGGEVFIPKIPSTRIMDIARAIAPQCEMKVIGIRPGEKLHECMIPADVATQTIEFDDHFIIEPTFESWTDRRPPYMAQGTRCLNGFSYTSDNNSDWLSIDQLRGLIKTDSQRIPIAA